MPTEGNTKEFSHVVEIQNPAFENRAGEEGSSSLASDSARSSTTAPSNVVETRNPALGIRAEEDGSPSLESDSIRSSTTAASSATRQTCPNCEKALEILPGRSDQVFTDLCRCKNLPATPPSETETYEPAVAVEDDIQEVQEIPAGEDSRPSDSYPSDSIEIASDLPTDASRQDPAPESQPVAAPVDQDDRCHKFIELMVLFFVFGFVTFLIVFMIYIVFYGLGDFRVHESGSKKKDSNGYFDLRFN